MSRQNRICPRLPKFGFTVAKVMKVKPHHKESTMILIPLETRHSIYSSTMNNLLNYTISLCRPGYKRMLMFYF
jgi:hypothetical protein